MILEAGDAAISVKGIADGVDAAAANLKSSYETLVSNLSSVRVPGIYSGIPLKAFYGIETGSGMGSAGGSGKLHGFPLLSSDPDSIFSNYAEQPMVTGTESGDFYNAPSLKILEQLPDQRGFWMKNTYIPLSIAFLDDEGIILNIADMAPHDLNTTYSEGQSRCALEMNQGWFERNGIVPGSRVLVS
jgi:hypothetical protein